MFLAERMISLCVYVLGLLFTCCFLRGTQKTLHKSILVVYVLFLGILAYCYKPYITADLFRLRQYIEYWVHLPVKQLIRYAMGVSDASWILYSYFVYLLEDINLLQTVACLWSFGNILSVIYMSTRKYENSSNDISYLLYMVMSVGTMFLQAISGIRTILGFSIVLLCFYKETYEGKKLSSNIVLYAVAALFHSAVLVLVVGRFCYAVLQNNSKKGIVIATIAIPVAIVFFTRYAKGYFESAINKAMGYMTNPDEYVYIWEYLIGAIELIQVYFVLNTAKKVYENEIAAIGGGFCRILAVVSTLSMVVSYAVFRRYTIFCTLLTIPIVSAIFKKRENNERTVKKFSQRMWVISSMILFFSLIRGDLCGYKFFVL